MKTSIFLGRKLNVSDSSSFTRVIMRLGVVAVAVSLCTLLITSALIAGFQREITQKVFNFWGHIHITHVDSDRSIDAIPIDKSEPSIQEIASLESVDYMEGPDETLTTKGGVKSVHPFIHYPGILSTRHAFDGVICKGVDEAFDWSFLSNHLVEGATFDGTSIPYHDQCILSKIQADRMEVNLGDILLLNFILDGEQIKKRVRVHGIYETGLAEYDSKFIIVDIAEW